MITNVAGVGRHLWPLDRATGTHAVATQFVQSKNVSVEIFLAILYRSPFINDTRGRLLFTRMDYPNEMNFPRFTLNWHRNSRSYKSQPGSERSGEPPIKTRIAV